MRIPNAPYPTAPNHTSIVVAAPCAGQQGTCIQQPEDVFLQALVHKDVGRHKARPLQLLIIGKRMIIWSRSLKFLHVHRAVNMLGNAE